MIRIEQQHASALEHEVSTLPRPLLPQRAQRHTREYPLSTDPTDPQVRTAERRAAACHALVEQAQDKAAKVAASDIPCACVCSPDPYFPRFNGPARWRGMLGNRVATPPASAGGR